MAQVVDSYSESNQDSAIVFRFNNNACGQAFTGDGGILNSVKFYLKYYGGPISGNAYAYIYEETHATAFGTDSKPTGSALAVSDVFDVSVLTSSFQLIEFTFSGANKITLTDGAYYVVTVEYPTGDNEALSVGVDNSSPSHGGNLCYRMTATWVSNYTYDTCFYVYKDVIGPFPTHLRL